MSSFLGATAWFSIVVGCLWTAGYLVAVLRALKTRNSDRHERTETGEAWSEVRDGVLVAAVGLSLLEMRAHGAVYWLAGIPVLAMAAMNLALWVRSRIQRKSERATTDTYRALHARHRGPADGGT
jgi:hypothetical protein